jgi:DNA-binding NtrC family response regulator
MAAQLGVLACLGKPIDFGALIELLQPSATTLPVKRPRVLHVDDDREVLALVAEALGPSADVYSVESLKHARCVLTVGQVDIVILDVALAGESGLDLLPELRDRFGKPIPVIVFSCCGTGGVSDERVQSELLKSSVTIESLAALVSERLRLAAQRPVMEIAYT